MQKHLKAPILANMTEFGKTQIYSAKDLYLAGVSMVLYPRTIDRVMSKAAFDAMKLLLEDGSQNKFIKNMQTRDELYKFLKYDRNN